MASRRENMGTGHRRVVGVGMAGIPAGLPTPAPAWFLRPDGSDGSLSIHGLGHTKRVMVHAMAIAAELDLPDWAREAVVLAALWHDIGRTDDGVDYYHGAKSAGKAVGLGLHVGVEPVVLETVLYAVTHHSGSEEHGVKAADNLSVPSVALAVFRVLKDADALDRVRFDGLDVSFLRFPESRCRVTAAKALLEALPR